MSNDVPVDPETICVPSSAAEAWAAVYMDVAEKLEAEEKASVPAETVEQQPIA